MSQDYKKQIVQRLTKNLLDIQLLRVLETEPMWGYRIKKSFEAESGIKLRHGALYPTLNGLEKEGFLISQKQQQGGRARKIYTLTAKGKEYLQCYYEVIREQVKT
jgi:PadR family transcriptional regulator, regulatory protein PadR